MRLVSTVNKVADDEDLIPRHRAWYSGTSMTGLENRSRAEYVQLVAVLRQFMKEGSEERYAVQFRESSAAANLAEKEQWMQARLQPSQRLAIPDLKADKELVDAGEALVVSAGVSTATRSEVRLRARVQNCSTA